MTEATYTIKLEQFEGPFELLLFFIERDELDIYDIPIAAITEDFLGYIKAMEALNLDVASDFILVAASLMRIKTKMLLPRRQTDEEGNEIDPRTELVSRLLEYKRFKESAAELSQREEIQLLRNTRGNAKSELVELSEEALREGELDSITVYKLMRAFERVMDRFRTEARKSVHTVFHYPYSIRTQKDFILTDLHRRKKTTFNDVFDTCENRVHAIVTFLAILEMLNEQSVRLIQGMGINNFWIQLRQ